MPDIRDALLDAAYDVAVTTGWHRARMADVGDEPVGSSAAQFAELIQSEIANYRKIVKATRITLY